ncbi:hypothetical protein BU17DRAFT_97326 [Hysterangium stoloniferum]|nr:hypothetical protein BU17DRAFT_97326 [Hysterangium stoloniferum]
MLGIEFAARLAFDHEIRGTVDWEQCLASLRNGLGDDDEEVRESSWRSVAFMCASVDLSRFMLASDFIEIALDTIGFQLRAVEWSSDAFMINRALDVMARNDELRSRILSSNVLKHCANVLSADLIWKDSFFEISLPARLISTFMHYDDGRKGILSSGIFDAVVNHIFLNENVVRYTLYELYSWVLFLANMLQYDAARAQMKTFDFKSFFKSVLSLKPDAYGDYKRAKILERLSEFDEIRSQIPTQETHTLIGRCLKSDQKYIRESAERLEAVLAQCDEPHTSSKRNDGPPGVPEEPIL